MAMTSHIANSCPYIDDAIAGVSVARSLANGDDSREMDDICAALANVPFLLEAVRDINADLRNDLEKALEDVDDLTSERNALERDVASLERDIVRLEREIETQRKRFDDLRDSL